MNRTVMSGIAAFALLIGAGLAMTETTAEAGHCGGGLFSRLHANKCGGGGLFSGHHGGMFKKGCGGGLLARLKAKHASDCCAPEPEACCEPAPALEPCCGTPAPAPEPCCGTSAPAPAPCDTGCAGCGGSVMESAPAPCVGCGDSVVAGSVAGSSAGFDLAPGETLVPGSVQTVSEGGAVESAPASSSDASEEAAPPAPSPDDAPDA